MIDPERLKILTDSAKFDVSCSSSGSDRRNCRGGTGNASYAGICHSFTADGRCVSLLKILMSNKCSYNCLYCVNRATNDVPRASATPDEICELVMHFYKRNYIEGLFLSSAVEKSADYTMERLLETVIKLRKMYQFNGYIHLKGIPHADRLLIQRAGNYADRMSFNVELPSEQSLKLLAPQKSAESIFSPMKMLAREIPALSDRTARSRRYFLPAGQTTQMIVGASPETDGQILKLSQWFYSVPRLKRVYYSSYVPTNFSTAYLPAAPTGLLREHRLYQADWLLRFYGFTADEIVDENGNLDRGLDPKCGWALRHLEEFPLEVNTAPVEKLVRVPGHRHPRRKPHPRGAPLHQTDVGGSETHAHRLKARDLLYHRERKILRAGAPRPDPRQSARGEPAGERRTADAFLHARNQRERADRRTMIYQCEDSETGFLSAVFAAYETKETPNQLVFTDVQTAMLSEIRRIPPDYEKATRVRAALLRRGGRRAADDLDKVLRSAEEDKMTAAFRYVRLTINERADVSGRLADPDVFRFQDIVRRVQAERHRFTGFLRFLETKSGVYYAHYAPDNDITALIAPHFRARLSAQKFVIHDVKRNKLALCDGKQLRYAETDALPTIVLSEDEAALQTLWRTYFHTVAIEERTNRRLQDNCLPRRYRRHMTEFGRQD